MVKEKKKIFNIRLVPIAQMGYNSISRMQINICQRKKKEKKEICVILPNII